MPAGRFEILELLGRGGQGMVARARDLSLNRLVAIKWLHTGAQQEAERLLREARAQAVLEHPNVCRIYETGFHHGRPYIVMQLLYGQPIHTALAEEPLATRLAVLRTTAEAVHAAHQRGLVHRDLKPANILVERSPDGVLEPRLLDFGLAARTSDLRQGGTWTIVGTPEYMAPEQLKGDPAGMDRRSDVFALGVILFQLATNTLPFHPVTDLKHLAQLHALGAPDPAGRQPGLPADLAAIIRRALATAPGDRYPTARALAEDLGRYLDGFPVEARPATRLERLGKLARRRPYIAVAAAAITLALLAAGSALTVARARGIARGQAITRHALRFSQQVRDLELRLREIRALPPERVGSAYRDVRADVQRMAEEAPRAGPYAPGPAWAALGRAHLALDDPETARLCFERATSLDFRTEDTELGLGMALAQLLDLKSRDSAFLPASERGSRLAALHGELGLPALRTLQRHRDATEHPELIQARILAAEGHRPQAIRLLEERLAAKPWASAHHRLLADLRTQEAVQAPVTDPVLEGAALDEVRKGQVLAPGDPFFPLCEARLHTAAHLRASHRNQDLGERYAAAERALERTLTLDPDLEEAGRLHAQLPFRRAAILSNRLEDATAPWQEGMCRCTAARKRNPRLTWPRHLEVTYLAERALQLRGFDDAAARQHADRALGLFRALEREPGARELKSSAARALLVQATLGTARPAEALAACDTGLALLAQAEASGLFIEHDFLILKASLLPDGRPCLIEARRILEARLRDRPGEIHHRFNLALVLQQQAMQEMDFFGADPTPLLRAAHLELAAARAAAPQLAPRLEATAFNLEVLEARWRLALGQDVQPLLARMRKRLPAAPPSVLPHLRAPLQLLQGSCAEARGEAPLGMLAQLAATRRDREVWDTAGPCWMELCLAAARVHRGGPHLAEFRKELPGFQQKPTSESRHDALRWEADACLLEAARDPALRGVSATRARTLAAALGREWPGTPAAAWAEALATHLEGRPVDWRDLGARFPALRGTLARHRPFLD